MMQDNKVEIFIGSTIEEGDCRADRDKVEDFYYKLNDALAPKGRGVVVYSCLTWDTQMRKGGSQSALDDMIRRSDVAVFVIAERVGEYTMGEIELALANRDGKKMRPSSYSAKGAKPPRASVKRLKRWRGSALNTARRSSNTTRSTKSRAGSRAM